MDFQHRAGSKTGGGFTGSAESSRDKKERLRRLAMETIDLAKVGWVFIRYKYLSCVSVVAGSLFYEEPFRDI